MRSADPRRVCRIVAQWILRYISYIWFSIFRHRFCIKSLISGVNRSSLSRFVEIPPLISSTFGETKSSTKTVHLPWPQAQSLRFRSSFNGDVSIKLRTFGENLQVCKFYAGCPIESIEIKYSYGDNHSLISTPPRPKGEVHCPHIILRNEKNKL